MVSAVLLLVLDENSVLENRGTKNRHSGPSLVQARHIDRLLERGRPQIDVLGVQDLRENKNTFNHYVSFPE